jgi:methionyl-tRNA formyltransferase
MVRALAALSRGSLSATPQASEGVTYAAKISKEEARIDWARSAAELDCHIRGLTPFPGAYFEVTRDGKPTRIKPLRVTPIDAKGTPGEILSVKNGITIACGTGALCITELQRAGKGPMKADDFLRGFSLTLGERLA